MVKRKVILDTDMGIDCDDAVALGLLINLDNRDLVDLVAITASTARPGATATIKAIMDYYGKNSIPVGKLTTTFLPCDHQNSYALAIQNQTGIKDTERNALDVLRKTLAKSPEKITMIAVGPLTNMADLLQSKPDHHSPLTGKELIKEKIDTIYIMGGAFDKNDFPEWNILQDIESAIIVNEKWPTEIIYSPHEVGFRIQTKMGEGNENPVWASMYHFAIYNNFCMKNGYSRYSWDPITCMAALPSFTSLFDFSPPGDVHIDQKGITSYHPNPQGNHRYITLNSRITEIEQVLNTLVERLN
ncbi:MAG: nucleoside hydrolase [Bacilli bacterium]